MEYYNYEYMLEDIGEIQKQEEEQQKEQEKQYSNMNSNMNTNSMMKNAQNTINNFKAPTINVPKF